MRILTLSLLCLMASACTLLPPQEAQNVQEKVDTIEAYEGETAEAIFAGGCFWCIEASFEKIEGVVAAISGYCCSDEVDPTYKEVSSGKTGHRESVLVVYDPNKVSYSELVEDFWKMYDPTDAGGSFYDRGFQYSSAIYYSTDEEKMIAEKSKAALDSSGRFEKSIVTPVEPVGDFYVAEEYHQDYYKKAPLRYSYYRQGSGRDKFIESVWGDDDKRSSWFE